MLPPVEPTPDRASKWRAFFAFGAGVLDVGALGASFLSFGAKSCGSVITAVPGQPASPAHEVCHPVAMIGAFQGAMPVLMVMVGLGLVPVLTLRTHRRWPCAASAAAQAVLQFLALGAFVFWVPAMLATVAAALIAPAP